jgi:hypothetical protein
MQGAVIHWVAAYASHRQVSRCPAKTVVISSDNPSARLVSHYFYIVYLEDELYLLELGSSCENTYT